MDFNVTHFLVSKTGTTTAASGATVIDSSTSRINLAAGQVGAAEIDSYGNLDANFETLTGTVSLGNRGIKIFQGLDRSESVGAELGYLSSGDILYKNITSLRLLKGISTETAQAKFFGGSVTVVSDKFAFTALTDTSGATPKPTLTIEADKDYSFSVRVQSAQANTLSPHGLIWGTSVKANNNLNGVTHPFYAPFSVAWGIIKGFADYKPLQDYVRVFAYLQLLDETTVGTDSANIQSFTFHTGTAPSTTTFSLDQNTGATNSNTMVDVTAAATWQLAAGSLIDVSTTPAAGIPGINYTLTIVVQALPQPNFVNNSDITLFPYKWDFARVAGFFVDGPLAPAPFNTITTQTPIVASRTESGVITSLTYNTSSLAAINSDVVRFPNLLTREVRHIAHQYQSYALKYKQQFSGVKYNPMVLDPQQTFYVDGGATDVYDILMVEYLPNQDYSYTSTMPMTQMTMVAGSTTAQKTALANLAAGLAGVSGVTLVTDTAV